MKNVFIRVTETNDTKQGIVTYSTTDINNITDKMVQENGLSGVCLFILHGYNNGERLQEIKPHFHIMLMLENDIDFQTIKQYFPYGNIEEIKNTLHTLRYLTHFGYNFKDDFYELSDLVVKQFYKSNIKRVTLF